MSPLRQRRAKRARYSARSTAMVTSSSNVPSLSLRCDRWWSAPTTRAAHRGRAQEGLGVRYHSDRAAFVVGAVPSPLRRGRARAAVVPTAPPGRARPDGCRGRRHDIVARPGMLRSDGARPPGATGPMRRHGGLPTLGGDQRGLHAGGLQAIKNASATAASIWQPPTLRQYWPRPSTMFLPGQW